MRLPYDQVRQQAIDLHQNVADMLSDMLGVSGLRIWRQSGRWCLGLLHEDGPEPEAEVLHSFAGNAGDGGMSISEDDVRDLARRFLEKPPGRDAAAAIDAEARRVEDELTGEQAETQRMGEFIKRKG